MFLKVDDSTFFTKCYRKGEVIKVPIAHGEGNYFCDDETLKALEGEGRVAFRYCDVDGNVTAAANPNGALANIAGITNESGRVLGLMPHPERLGPRRAGRHRRPPRVRKRARIGAGSGLGLNPLRGAPCNVDEGTEGGR